MFGASGKAPLPALIIALAASGCGSDARVSSETVRVVLEGAGASAMVSASAAGARGIPLSPNEDLRWRASDGSALLVEALSPNSARITALRLGQTGVIAEAFGGSHEIPVRIVGSSCGAVIVSARTTIAGIYGSECKSTKKLVMSIPEGGIWTLVSEFPDLPRTLAPFELLDGNSWDTSLSAATTHRVVFVAPKEMTSITNGLYASTDSSTFRYRFEMVRDASIGCPDGGIVYSAIGAVIAETTLFRCRRNADASSSYFREIRMNIEKETGALFRIDSLSTRLCMRVEARNAVVGSLPWDSLGTSCKVGDSVLSPRLTVGRRIRIRLFDTSATDSGSYRLSTERR